MAKRRFVICSLPTTPVIVGQDTFDQQGANLADTAAPLGGAWDEFGDAGAFVVTSGGAAGKVQRQPASSESVGRVAYLSALTAAAQESRVEGEILEPTDYYNVGAACRVKADGSFVRGAFRSSSDDVYVEKRVGAGAISLIGPGTIGPSLPAGNPAVRMSVDAAGVVKLWVWAVGSSPSVAPTYETSDAALATGGALATGSPGISHQCQDGTPSAVRYDNFVAKFGATSLGTHLAEIKNPRARAIGVGFKGLGGVNVRIKMNEKAAKEIRARNGDVMLKIYNPDLPAPHVEFQGELERSDLQGDGRGGVWLACTFIGPSWPLVERLIGKQPGGLSYASMDRGNIVRDILSRANADHDTGIREGAIATLGPANFGPLIYKPAFEAIAELAESPTVPFETPASYVADEDFESYTLTVSLSSRVLWQDQAGDTTPFVIADHAGTKVAQRSAPNDVGPEINRGHFNFTLDDPAGPLIASLDYYGDTLGGGTSRKVGHALRAGNIVGGSPSYPSRGYLFIVDLSVNPPVLTVLRGPSTALGAPTLIASFPLAGWATLTWRTLRVAIDSVGRYAVWDYVRALGPGSPQIVERQAELATGGGYGSGNSGLYHTNASATGTELVDNYKTANLTVDLIPQTIDWEITPVEPVVDALGVKRAVLNVGTLGTDRSASVAFVYGRGSKSLARFTESLDRSGLATATFHLPDADARSARDTDAIAVRGLHEKVVTSDVQTPGLRQAVADAHLAARKQPRRIVSFEPSPRGAPKYGVHYFLGDRVRAVVYAYGELLFEGKCRVYGVDVAIDDKGRTTEIPRLVPD